MSELRKYTSLDAAFLELRWPPANLRFVQRLLAHIDVEGYYAASNHIKVTRVNGGKAIEIHRGASNGFRSEGEIVDAVGDVERGPSTARTSTWRVVHPDTTPGLDARSSSKPLRRPVRRCAVPGCGLIMYPKTGCDVHGL